jgi:hypothetical protein
MSCVSCGKNFVILLSLVFFGFFMWGSVKTNHTYTKPVVLKDDILFWDPSSWTWSNFLNWDWRKNMDKLIDTPLNSFQFWAQWIKSPRYITQQDLMDNTFLYFDLAMEYVFMYNKGVFMEIQGLFLQQKYYKAMSRLFRYMSGFLLDFWN